MTAWEDRAVCVIKVNVSNQISEINGITLYSNLQCDGWPGELVYREQSQEVRSTEHQLWSEVNGQTS